jgi:hypothetical protein
MPHTNQPQTPKKRLAGAVHFDHTSYHKNLQHVKFVAAFRDMGLEIDFPQEDRQAFHTAYVATVDVVKPFRGFGLAKVNCVCAL